MKNRGVYVVMQGMNEEQARLNVQKKNLKKSKGNICTFIYQKGKDVNVGDYVLIKGLPTGIDHSSKKCYGIAKEMYIKTSIRD